MIGINVRGFRHLWRLSDFSLRPLLVNFREYGDCMCHVMKTDASSPDGELLLIFNPYYSHGKRGITEFISKKFMNESDCSYIARVYSHVIVFGVKTLTQGFPYIYDMTLLPKDFEKQYGRFISENNKMITSLTNKFGYSPDQILSKYVYIYTDGSKNFYQWAISSYFQNGTSMGSIKRIMAWNEAYGKLSKNLKKKSITAYTSNKDIMSLSEELSLIRRDKRVNDVINMFNTAQKRMLRDAELSEKDKNILSKFYRLSEAKKINFVRKVSTIHDYPELMRQMGHVTSTHFDWNKDSFMDFISNVEGMNYKTIYDNGDIVLVEVNDFETVKNLAKTTNWCISKNKTYWNSYVEQNDSSTQYILFDFSKKEDDLFSIIGFTTQFNKGITHAHDFSNNDIMGNNNNDYGDFISTFIEKFRVKNDIYSVLKDSGVDITLVAKYDKPLFEWNKEKMFEYLYGCVSKSNVDILCNTNDKVAISVKDSGIRYFFGDVYIDNFSSDNWELQHIIFMDFSMSEYDDNRIQFGLIVNNGIESDDYCAGVFNTHAESVNTPFDVKLAQFNLPYDIIRRKDNIHMKLAGAFNICSILALKKILESTPKSVVSETFRKYIGHDLFVDKISLSITRAMSFDLLDAFYDNKFELTKLTDPYLVGIIIKNIMCCLRQHNGNGNYDIPTQETIDKFFSNNCDSFNETMYVGCYLAIKKIISKETGGKKINVMYLKLINAILVARKGGELLDDLMMDAAQKIDFKSSQEITNNWLTYAALYGGERIKKYALDNIITDDKLKSFWESMQKDDRTIAIHLDEEEFGEDDGIYDDFGIADNEQAIDEPAIAIAEGPF